MKEKVIGVGFIAIIFIFILIQDISMKAFHWNAFELFVVGVLAIMIIYGLVMSFIKPEKVKLDVNNDWLREMADPSNPNSPSYYDDWLFNK